MKILKIFTFFVFTVITLILATAIMVFIIANVEDLKKGILTFILICLIGPLWYVIIYFFVGRFFKFSSTRKALIALITTLLLINLSYTIFLNLGGFSCGIMILYPWSTFFGEEVFLTCQFTGPPAIGPGGPILFICRISLLYEWIVISLTLLIISFSILRKKLLFNHLKNKK